MTDFYQADKEVNSEWGILLGQSLAIKLVLEKELNQLRIENEDLKAKLHQAQLDLLAAQGKSIIDATE